MKIVNKRLITDHRMPHTAMRIPGENILSLYMSLVSCFCENQLIITIKPFTKWSSTCKEQLTENESFKASKYLVF